VTKKFRQWGGALIEPPPPSGNPWLFRRNDLMYPSEVTNQAIGSAASPANLLAAWPYNTGLGGTIVNILTVITGAAAGNFILGIYSNVIPTQFYPNTLLFTTGSQSSAVAGVKTFAANLLVAANALIWLAFIDDAVAASYTTMGGSSNQMLGHAVANPPGTGFNHYEVTPAGGFVMPNPFPAGATLVSVGTEGTGVCPFVQWA